MTKEKLEDNHLNVYCDSDGDSSRYDEHAKVSIEYAISVLKSVQEDIGAGLGREFAAQTIIKKINELKSSLTKKA
jgi:hypothetical protein